MISLPGGESLLQFEEADHRRSLAKRKAIYEFMARNLGLNISAADESKITIENAAALYVFGDKGECLQSTAIHGFAQLEQVWKTAINGVGKRGG